MIINLHNKEFNAEMFQDIITAFNSTEEVIEIYLHSGGGLTAIMAAILDLINNNPSRFILIGYCSLSSSAFELFVRAECEKRLLENTIGMYHQGTREISINDFGKPKFHDDVAILKRTEVYKKMTTNFIDKCGFTPTEKTKFKKDHDLHFSHERFLEIVETYSNNQLRNT